MFVCIDPQYLNWHTCPKRGNHHDKRDHEGDRIQANHLYVDLGISLLMFLNSSWIENIKLHVFTIDENWILTFAIVPVSEGAWHIHVFKNIHKAIEGIFPSERLNSEYLH